MKKVFLIIGMILSSMLVLAAEHNSVSVASKSAIMTEKLFTVEELSAFNGENGVSAYIAVDGVVYDVTGVKAWKNGKHKGMQAGQDVTKVIEKSPHGKKVLKNLKIVGKLITKK